MQDGTTDEGMPVKGVEPLHPRETRPERVSYRPASLPDAQRRPEAEAQTDMGWTPREWERVFDAAGDAVFLTDREFRIARANRATSQLLGKPLDDILGKTYWQAIHGTDQPPETSPLTRAHHTKTHVQGEIYVSQRDVWLEVSVDPMLDEKGDVTGVLHILRDVTDGKKMREAMRESEEKYRSLFENAREAIVLTDLNGTITGVNRLVEDYGFQREQLIGKGLFDFVAENRRTRALADFKVLLGGKPVAGEMEVLTPKGVVSVEYRDNPIMRGGQVIGVQAILTDVTKRKRAEQLLRDERDRVQRYLDIAGVMLVVIDTEERVGLINKKGCEILGYTEDEILGKNWFDNFLPPRTREPIRAVFAGLIAGRIHPNEHVENFVLTRTGQERLMAWHNTVLRDETGQIIGALGSGEDITQRRRAEEAYRSLVDHSLQGLVIFQDRKAVFANQAMAEITGYAIEEILALSAEELRDFVHPEDREIVWQNHRRRLAGEPVPEHYEMRGIRKDGLVCWLDIYATRIDYQGKPAVQATYIDITERKRAEVTLRLSEERYRGVFENAALGMYQTTPDGEILACNPALVRMLGYDTFEPLGSRNLEKEGFDPEHPRSLFKERIETEGRIVGLESAWKRRDGSTLWVRESARAVRDEAEKTLFYEGTVEDITDRKHADQIMRTLATAAMELVELPAEADLFQFIGEKVLTLIGAGIVSVNSIEGDTLTVRQIAGATTVAMKLAQRLLGRAVIGMPMKGLHDVARTHLLTGKLTKVEGGLYELFFRTVPRPACWTLEKSLGIQECHSIGIRRPGQLLGSVTILTQKRTELNAGVIEAFVNQASVALERRRAEEVLRKSEEKYRDLVENINDVIFTISAEGIITYVSPAVHRIAGYTPEELVGHPFRRVIDPKDLPGLERSLHDTLENHLEPWEFRYYTRNGQSRWARTSSRPISVGGLAVGIRGVFSDITERKRAEERLAESELRYRELFENSGTGIVIVDREGIYRFINRKAATAHGREAEDIVGKSMFDFLPADTARRYLECNDALMTSGGRREYEDTFSLPCGERTFLIVDRCLRDAQNNVIGIQSCSIDITERKRAEEEVREQLNELRRWHDVTIRREGRVAELKREVNALAARLGEPPPYQSEDEPCPREDR